VPLLIIALALTLRGAARLPGRQKRVSPSVPGPPAPLSLPFQLRKYSMTQQTLEAAETEQAPEVKEEREEELTPRAVLFYNMKDAHEKAKKLRELLINKLQDDAVASPALILKIVQTLGDHTERAIETATKLAPYTMPKLEAIEVKSEVEHKFVIQAPHPVKNVEEWMKITGATRMKLEDLANQKITTINPRTSEPPIIDRQETQDEAEAQAIADEKRILEEEETPLVPNPKFHARRTNGGNGNSLPTIKITGNKKLN